MSSSGKLCETPFALNFLPLNVGVTLYLYYIGLPLRIFIPIFCVINYFKLVLCIYALKDYKSQGLLRFEVVLQTL